MIEFSSCYQAVSINGNCIALFIRESIKSCLIVSERLFDGDNSINPSMIHLKFDQFIAFSRSKTMWSIVLESVVCQPNYIFRENLNIVVIIKTSHIHKTLRIKAVHSFR